MPRITIFCDDVYAGEGILDKDGQIVCPANLGDSQDECGDIYEAIQDEIDSEPQDAERYTGTGSITYGEREYAWLITES